MNEYQKKYEDLINFRKNIQQFNRWNKLHKSQQELNLPPAYGEYHHIQPRSLRPDLVDDPNNIICLTAHEHILAHKYLALWFKEMYGENSSEYFKMWSAYEKTIRGQNGKIRISETDAAALRVETSRVHSLKLKGKKRSLAFRASIAKYYAQPQIRKAISNKSKQMWKDPEIRAAICKSLKGKKKPARSEIHCSRLSDAIRGKRSITDGKINKMLDSNAEMPDGFHTGYIMSDIQKRNIDNLHNKCKGTIYVNNGKINKMVRPDAIPEGFHRGMLQSDKQKSVNHKTTLGKIALNNGKITKFVFPYEVFKYVALGFIYAGKLYRRRKVPLALFELT